MRVCLIGQERQPFRIKSKRALSVYKHTESGTCKYLCEQNCKQKPEMI